MCQETELEKTQTCKSHAWKQTLIRREGKSIMMYEGRILSFQLSSCWSLGPYLGSFTFVAWQPDLHCKAHLPSVSGP